MITVKSFTFNPFSENSYILSDETKACIIIDPGCFNESERNVLDSYISNEGLSPSRLINTHCHIDHVLGNKHVANKYGLGLEMHEKDMPLLNAVEISSTMYGVPYERSPEPSRFIEEGEQISFGNSSLEVLFVPGHAPGHIALVSHAQKFVISGDVLFRQSIGRVDLPGGNYDVLMQSITQKLFKLGDDYTVYSGHGPETTIGYEKKNNPFLQV